jgi:hypothetical protein
MKESFTAFIFVMTYTCVTLCTVMIQVKAGWHAACYHATRKEQDWP